MKAISIRSPWWEKIISGEKTIETRTWKTKYRGQLLICASKPTGHAVAIAYLADCRPMTKADEKAACCPVYPRANAWMLRNVMVLTKPFPVKGKLSLFDVQPPTATVVVKDLKS
jgi:hypothetical protein